MLTSTSQSIEVISRSTEIDFNSMPRKFSNTRIQGNFLFPSFCPSNGEKTKSENEKKGEIMIEKGRARGRGGLKKNTIGVSPYICFSCGVLMFGCYFVEVLREYEFIDFNNVVGLLCCYCCVLWCSG